jgi:hypothetical protein
MQPGIFANSLFVKTRHRLIFLPRREIHAKKNAVVCDGSQPRLPVGPPGSKIGRLKIVITPT